MTLAIAVLTFLKGVIPTAAKLLKVLGTQSLVHLFYRFPTEDSFLKNVKCETPFLGGR
ncbi:hypothetical protein ACQKIW_30650 [Bacillus thuringiensis]|uniref:hypothetical protein n=1 Tax=Bacillus thuringiensis TaxID=1428 RepID=UPI003D02E247